MNFKEYLQEKKEYSYKTPKGMFDDESMMDDFSNEMEAEGLSWDNDYALSDDSLTLTFVKSPTAPVQKILKSLKFKKI